MSLVAKLNVPRVRASEILSERVAAANELLEKASGVDSEHAANRWQVDRKRWIRLTKEAVLYIYADGAQADEFESSAYASVFFGGLGWEQAFHDDARRVAEASNTLASLIDRLEYAHEPTSPAPAPDGPRPGPAVIFLVHGRDKGTREEVARFLEKTGAYEVVILDEQANRGRTLIEKFEAHALQANYAIVLLTPDDTGGERDAAMQQPRARQNVVFELGFFVGKLGRERVTVLYPPGVELPSDIDGLAYVPLDDAGAWRERVARELRDAGIDLDLARA